MHRICGLSLRNCLPNYNRAQLFPQSRFVQSKLLDQAIKSRSVFNLKSKSLLCGSLTKLLSYQQHRHQIRLFSETIQEQDDSLPDVIRRDLEGTIHSIPQKNIRNFAVIAHIDHGKTTLSNRLLQLTHTIKSTTRGQQPLDALQVEQERGITVKAHTTSMLYRQGGELYMLNLIDTPGHVDFTYEVSRALAACQGALLVVDASQGVQAQTMANFFLALESNLTIIPVLNKIDLPVANVPQSLKELHTSFGITEDEVIKVSAKTGLGVENIIPQVIKRIPSPKGDPNKPLRMLLFDSWFDRFRGVICLVEIIDGKLQKGDKIESAASGKEYEVADLGILYPTEISSTTLLTGQVGFVVMGMKSAKEARVGDTFYHYGSSVNILPGFKPAKAMVFAGIYPIDTGDIDKLNDAIIKLTLNDSSVTVQKEQSDSLGMGYRCGFLGLLHMDVFIQRLEQEYDINVLPTVPTVPYKVILTDKTEMIVTSPSQWPEGTKIHDVYEPMVQATIIVPDTYLNNVVKLCRERRGEEIEFINVDETRIMLKYKLPLNEIVSNFYDKLKELSSGYATFDYDEADYQSSSISKVNIALNSKPVDSLSFLVHRTKVEQMARSLVDKMKELLDKQLFTIVIQAVVGNKVIARSDISALRKNVTAKCYGGDVTRKRKLLEKQKEGKKKMKKIGEVEISQETFMALMRRE